MVAALILLCATGAQAQSTRADGPAGAATQDRIIPLDATVNGAKAGAWPFVDRMGQLYVSPDALDEWRVRMPTDAQTIRVRGNDFFPLASIPGFNARLNYSALSVDLTFAPEAFSGTRLLLEKELARPKRSPVLPSAFVNYDVNFQRSSSGGASSEELGTVLEAGASSELGVATTSHVGRNLTGGAAGQKREWLRLETTFTRQFPDENLTLRVGDTSTRPGLWGRSVYFGGVQLGTNFSLSPGFLTQPLPLLAGVSAAPSTVELYVNDVLRKVSQVPTGPFVVDNVAGLTGSGEARLVVRDVLGREVVIVQPFFTAVSLLAPGLDDWSAEIGAVRENLGLTNADYGNRFATGTWRRGMSDKLTLEGRAEWSRRHHAIGVGGIVALPGNVLARGTVVRSQYDRVGDGAFWLLGVERQWVRTSIAAQWLGATRGYRELGTTEAALPIKRQLAANMSRQLGETMNFGVGLARIERYDGPALTTISLNYGIRFREVSVAANMSKVLGQANGTSFGVNLQVPLEKQRFANAAFSSHSGVQDVYASVAQFANESTDVGWRVLGGRLNNEAHAEAGLDYAGRYGRVYSDISASSSQTSLRLGASGGMAAAAGHVFFTKRLDESFAVAELKGYPGVGMGLGSTITAHTDKDGIAFIPYLSPYQANQVRLDPKDLPLSAELDSIEQQVVPSWRSAVRVVFPVRSGRAALVKLQLENGEPIPAGAVVQIQGDKQEFYVGRRGEAFVTGLQASNELQVRHQSLRCGLRLDLPAANDDVLRIGPVTCRRTP